VSDIDARYTTRLTTLEDLPAVSNLVWNVFDAFIAPDYASEGITEFQNFAQVKSMRSRLEDGALSIVCQTRTKIVGIIETRNNNHISLLFVAVKHQRCGIARELLGQALELMRSNDPLNKVITVNASPSAEAAYQHLGFTADGEWQVKNGIRYLPMKLIV
jgi:GNAT superfamily N-acetyltransferase